MLKLLRCERATSAIEFAMLLPVFLTVVFGIVVFGSYFAVVHGVQQLAAEAARSSIAGMSETERGSLAANYVSANAGTYPLIDASHLTVNASSSSNGSSVFVVTVSYDASNMFIYALPSAVKPPSTIMRSAVVPFGGF